MNDARRNAVVLLLLALVGLAGCKSEKDYLSKLAKVPDAGPADLRPYPPQATLLVAEQNGPRNIEVVSGQVFWMNGGGRPTGDLGVFGMADSGGPVKAFMSGNGDLMAIAVDADAVYWLEPREGRVMKKPRGGGDETKLADSNGISRGLFLDADTVYWAENEAIFAVPKAGGKSRIVSPTDIPDLFGVDDGFVYWYSSISGNLSRAPKKGAPKPQKIYTDKDHTLHTLIVDGNDLFVAFGAEGRMTIQRLPKTGGTPVTVVDGQQSPHDFAIDADSIYWITEDDVWKVPRGGGTATKVVEKLWFGTSLAVDGQYVYWTDKSRIQRMPKK